MAGFSMIDEIWLVGISNGKWFEGGVYRCRSPPRVEPDTAYFELEQRIRDGCVEIGAIRLRSGTYTVVRAFTYDGGAYIVARL